MLLAAELNLASCTQRGKEKSRELHCRRASLLSVKGSILWDKSSLQSSLGYWSLPFNATKLLSGSVAVRIRTTWRPSLTSLMLWSWGVKTNQLPSLDSVKTEIAHSSLSKRVLNANEPFTLTLLVSAVQYPAFFLSINSLHAVCYSMGVEQRCCWAI